MIDENLTDEELLIQLFQKSTFQQPSNHDDADLFVHAVMKKIKRRGRLRTIVLSLMTGICSLILAFQLVPLIEIFTTLYNSLSFPVIGINWELVLIPGTIVFLSTAFLLMLDSSTDQ